MQEDGVRQQAKYKGSRENCATALCPRPDCLQPLVSRPRLLINHMKTIHSQRIKFACKTCNLPFKQVGQLMRHQVYTHNEKKWYSSLHFTWRVKGQTSEASAPVLQNKYFLCWCEKIKDKNYTWAELVSAGKFLPFVRDFIKPAERKESKVIKFQKPAKRRQVIVEDAKVTPAIESVDEPQACSSNVEMLDGCEVITLGDSDDEDECENVATPQLQPIAVKVENLVKDYVGSLSGLDGGADDSLHTRGSVCDELVQYVNLKMSFFKMGEKVRKNWGFPKTVEKASKGVVGLSDLKDVIAFRFVYVLLEIKLSFKIITLFLFIALVGLNSLIKFI